MTNRMWDGIVDTFLNGKLPSWVHKDQRAYKDGGKVSMKEDGKKSSAFLTWGADGTVNSCSACANPSNEYKKGGKVKGKKSPGVSRSVLCDRCSRRALNATVLLRKGNAPRRRSNPGVAKRLLSQGSAFGGGLPGPLNASSYGSAPQVAQPLGRMDFIGSGESSYYYNRRRDHRDDFQPQANPSGIRSDVSPSIRAVPSSAVASPDTGLSASRSSAGVRAMREAFANMPQAIFQGENPRIGGANLAPSGRAMPSQPTTGFVNTKGSMIGVFGSLSEMSKAQAELDNLPGGEQEFMRREAETLRGMGINPETGSPLPSPRSGKSASASARGMRRGGSVF